MHTSKLFINMVFILILLVTAMGNTAVVALARKRIPMWIPTCCNW